MPWQSANAVSTWAPLPTAANRLPWSTKRSWRARQTETEPTIRRSHGLRSRDSRTRSLCRTGVQTTSATSGIRRGRYSSHHAKRARRIGCKRRCLEEPRHGNSSKPPSSTRALHACRRAAGPVRSTIIPIMALRAGFATTGSDGTEFVPCVLKPGGARVRKGRRRQDWRSALARRSWPLPRR